MPNCHAVASAQITMTCPIAPAIFGFKWSTSTPMKIRRIAPANTGTATMKPFCAWSRPRSLAICTPSGPRMTHTMKARSKYRKEASSVGGWPALRKDCLSMSFSRLYGRIRAGSDLQEDFAALDLHLEGFGAADVGRNRVARVELDLPA